jgi:D-alanyl-D-alanine dipeptidase
MTNVLFESIPIKENNEPMVDLNSYPFIVEPVYYKQGMSPNSTTHLRKGFADKLLAVQESFKDGYRFKVWDAYRPRSVQNAIYDAHWKVTAAKYPDWSDEQIALAVGVFVTKATSKERIPLHATGGAVDLTLVDNNGKELDMGTVFDHFGPEAASMFFEEEESPIRANRRLLREAMVAAGFRHDDDEWWHYDFGNQIWAKLLNQPHAIYGEITETNIG